MTFVEQYFHDFFGPDAGNRAKPAERAEQRRVSGNDPLATGNYEYDESFEENRR